MEINLILAIVLYIVLVVVLPSILVFVLINNKRLLKIFGIVFFILFLTVLSLLVFGSVVFKNGNIILSFSANAKWFSMLFLWGSFTKSNILLNLVMLFPVSLFVLSLITKHRFNSCNKLCNKLCGGTFAVCFANRKNNRSFRHCFKHNKWYAWFWLLLFSF